MIAGRYTLDREIGRGGTGAVWLGRDEVLGRQVALKRIGLLPGADTTDLARAEREARLSARLNHPNVVAVFDVVVDTGSDSRWLVMEYVDGGTLAQLVRQRGPLSPDEAAPLLRQVADALAAAHAAGIAHRDVKPSNILLDHAGQAKLTDFGIARGTTDPSLTQTGLLTGSPAYLAPEIVTGGRGDQAADVWSLGATAYHLLDGHPPYEVGDQVLGALYRIVHEEPPRLPDAGWITPLLAGTMVRDPARRWSMEQVRDFLDDPGRRVPSTRRSTEIAPEPADPEHHTQTWGLDAPATGSAEPASRRSPTAVLLAVLGLVLLLVLGTTLYVVLTRNGASSSTATPPPPRSSGPSPSTPAATPTAAGMKSFITTYVTTVADDPDTAWTMLSPKFQRESGGLDTYRAFWEKATNGRVLSISADPDTLVVSYQVHFDDFHNGPGPTVLDLSFHNGRYLINGEHSKGFVPAT